MRILLKAVTFSFVILASSECHSQVFFKYPIYMDVAKQYIYAFNKADSTVVTNLGKDSSRRIKVFECSEKGDLQFALQNDSKKVIVLGQYRHATILTRNSGRRIRYAQGKKVISSGPLQY